MILEIKAGGISYKVEVDMEDEYVSAIFSVEVWNGQEYIPIEMKDGELEDFHEMYSDQLNEAYEVHKIAMAEIACEERADLAMGR